MYKENFNKYIYLLKSKSFLFFVTLITNYNRSLVDDDSVYSKNSDEFTEDDGSSEKDQEGFFKLCTYLKTKNLSKLFKHCNYNKTKLFIFKEFKSQFTTVYSLYK